MIRTYLCEFKRITTCNMRTIQPTHRQAWLQYQITVNTNHAAGTSRRSDADVILTDNLYLTETSK